MLDGRVGADGKSVDVAGANVVLPDWSAEPGRAVTFGVRPEHLTLGAHGIGAEVVVVEPTGADTLVFAKSEGGDLVGIFRERHEFRPGDRITLEPLATAAHVFDAATGRRI